MKKFFILLLLPIMCYAWEPTKPITVIIGNQPGSGNEVGFRVISAAVNKEYPNVNFIIDLKPGADSVLAMNALYEAKPDGYTIAIPSYMSTYVTNDIWQKDVKKFQYNSFTSVSGMGQSPLAIVANPRSQINSVNDLVRLVQTTDKPITFAVGGGAHRITFEYFMYKAKANKDLIKTTQYPGPLQAVTAVASDAGIEFGIMPITIALPLVKAGKVKVIGITGEKRIENFEPIVVDKSHIDVMAAWALILPPNTPKEIVDWYSHAFVPALKTEKVKEYYKDNLITINSNDTTPAGFDQHIINLRKTYMPLAKEIKIE